MPPVACALALAVLHLFWLLAHFAPATMSPDANGYIVQARLLATEGRASFSPDSPVQFVGMHWLETDEGKFHSRYPAGLPLLMAAAWRVGGLDAALLVNPLLASAIVVLVFLLARPVAGDLGALLAAAVVALVPVANQHALDADAHIAATFFLVAGVLALRRFVAEVAEAGACPDMAVSPASGPQPKPRAGWKPVVLGGLAGVLLGIVPTIRYPEGLAIVAVGGWLLWRVRPWWRVWPVVLGAAAVLLPLLAHNAAVFGAFWRTAYSLTNEQTGFGIGYLFEHAVPYLQQLSGQGLALFFAFGIAGLVALAADRRTRAEGLLFAGIVVPLVLLYMAYYFGGAAGPAGNAVAAGNLRFLIPTFPFLATAGAWLLARMARDFGYAGRAAAGVVAALQLLVAGASSHQALARTKTTLSLAARARATAEQRIPAGSIVILDRALGESLDALGQWHMVAENFVAGLGPQEIDLANAEGPDGPSPRQPGKNRAQQQRYADLDADERRARIWSDLAAWADGRPIYWLARSLDIVESTLPPEASYRSIAEIDTPPSGFGGSGGGIGMRPGFRREGFGPRGLPTRFAPPGVGEGRLGWGPPRPGEPGRAVAGVSTRTRVLRIRFPDSVE